MDETRNLLVIYERFVPFTDVRHQDYSTSQFHNCALPNIDPIGPRNTKCSSHKTNSSVWALVTTALNSNHFKCNIVPVTTTCKHLQWLTEEDRLRMTD